MVLLTDFIKEQSEIYKRENPPDFITHLNYVSYLRELSENLTLNSGIEFSKKIKKVELLNKKLNLIKITARGLREEYKTVKRNPDYAIVCVSWISVKAYYLLFNSCLVLQYLITGDTSAFQSGHLGLLGSMKGYLARGDIYFNEEKYNKLHNCENILKWKAESGSNIRRAIVDEDIRYKQIIKKLANYNVEEFKRNRKIKSIRKKEDKAKVKDFISKTEICLWEFFYWYRIKANYRDLEYLNKSISDEQFKDYYDNYVYLTSKFYTALKGLINSISKIRFDEKLL